MANPSKILIVDDTPSIHTMISALLRNDQYELDHAFSGEEALAKVNSLMPDLVLLDIMLPDIDGYEVCRRLRSSSGVSDVPIIMVTALADRMSRLRGLEAGADDFVTKPFDQSELRARIKTITSLDRYRRLFDERARFERLVELAPDGVLIVDQHGSMRLLNPAARLLLGVSSETAVIDRPLIDFVDPTVQSQWVGFFEEATRLKGGSRVIESTLRRADGRQFPVEVTAGGFEWEGDDAVQLLMRDITERKHTADAMRRRNERLRTLAAHLADAQELERQHLVRELHDRVGQSLTALHLNLSVIDQALDRATPPIIRNRLDDALTLLEETTRQVRDVMAELRPPMLDDYGLLPTLRWYGNLFSERTNISCLVESEDGGNRLPYDVEVALFRICQEALTNASKHAGATQVVVTLDGKDEHVRLIIGDNGQGFVVEDGDTLGSEAHWGLLSMKERAAAINGVVVIESAPGKGTQVTVDVTLEEPV